MDIPKFPENRIEKYPGCLGFIIIILILITSCTVTKDKTYTKNQVSKIIDSVKTKSFAIKIDTFTHYKDRLITKSFQSTIRIPIDCDTVGNISNVNYNVKSGNNKANVQIKDNFLDLDINFDSISNVYEDKYRSKYKKDSLVLVQKIKESLSINENSKTTKVKSGLFTHLFCVIIFVLLLFCIFIIFKYKK